MARIYRPAPAPVVYAESDVFGMDDAPVRQRDPRIVEQAQKFAAARSIYDSAKPFVDTALEYGQKGVHKLQDIAQQRMAARDLEAYEAWHVQAQQAKAAGLPAPPKPASMVEAEAEKLREPEKAKPAPAPASPADDPRLAVARQMARQAPDKGEDLFGQRQGSYTLPSYETGAGHPAGQTAFPEQFVEGDTRTDIMAAGNAMIDPRQRIEAKRPFAPTREDDVWQQPGMPSLQAIARERAGATPDQTDRAAQPVDVGSFGFTAPVPQDSLAGVQDVLPANEAMPTQTTESRLAGTQLSQSTLEALNAPDAAQATMQALPADRLQVVRAKTAARLAGATTPAERSLWEGRLAQVDKALADRDNGPLERDQFHAMAKGANTEPEQQKVLDAISRVRTPLSIDALLNPAAAQIALMKEAEGLFPTGRDAAALQNANARATTASATAEMRKAQADLATAKSETERATAAGKVKELEAKIRRLEGQSDTEDDLRQPKVDESGARTGNLKSQTKARDAKLQPEIDKMRADTDRLKAIAAKARRPPSNGIRMGASKDDLKWASEADDRAAKRNAEAAGVARSREDAAERAERAAEAAALRADMAATGVGEEPPSVPTGQYADPNLVADAQKARALWDRQNKVAAAAAATAAKARDIATRAATDLRNAQALHEAAVKAGDEDRAISDEIRQIGIDGFRRARQPPQPAKAGAVAKPAPAKKPRKPISFD